MVKSYLGDNVDFNLLQLLALRSISLHVEGVLLSGAGGGGGDGRRLALAVGAL